MSHRGRQATSIRRLPGDRPYRASAVQMPCRECGGSGRGQRVQRDPVHGDTTVETRCRHCGGTGVDPSLETVLEDG